MSRIFHALPVAVACFGCTAPLSDAGPADTSSADLAADFEECRVESPVPGARPIACQRWGEDDLATIARLFPTAIWSVTESASAGDARWLASFSRFYDDSGALVGRLDTSSSAFRDLVIWYDAEGNELEREEVATGRDVLSPQEFRRAESVFGLPAGSKWTGEWAETQSSLFFSISYCEVGAPYRPFAKRHVRIVFSPDGRSTAYNTWALLGEDGDEQIVLEDKDIWDLEELERR